MPRDIELYMFHTMFFKISYRWPVPFPTEIHIWLRYFHKYETVKFGAFMCWSSLLRSPRELISLVIK